MDWKEKYKRDLKEAEKLQEKYACPHCGSKQIKQIELKSKAAKLVCRKCGEKTGKTYGEFVADMTDFGIKQVKNILRK